MNAYNWRLVIAVGLGILLNPLNSSMVAVALPRLQEDFRLDYTAVSWIIFSFYIASAIAQPVMGKASDLFGRRRIFIAGLIVSFVASLLAPLSLNFGWLIVFRIIQAIGTSMMVAVGMALVRIHITHRQASALSVISVFLSGAAAIGPFVGGALIQGWDWHAIFIVNIPFAAASLVLAWRTIPKDSFPSSDGDRLSMREWLAKIDAAGIVLFATGLIFLLISLLNSGSSGSNLIRNVVFALIGILLLVVFVRQELRSTSPFLPLRAFAKYPAMTRVNAEYMLINLLFYSILFGFPSYLQSVRQVSEYDTGLLMLSLGLCSLVASPIAGRWIDKSGTRPALLLSALLMTLGSAWIVTLNESSPIIGVCIALAAFGISNGLVNVGMQAALFRSSPKEMIGVASGLFSTSRYLGTILSSLLISNVMGGTFSFEGFRALGIILAVIALSLVFLNGRRRRLTSTFAYNEQA